MEMPHSYSSSQFRGANDDNDTSAGSEGGGRSIPHLNWICKLYSKLTFQGEGKEEPQQHYQVTTKKIHGIGWDEGNWKQDNCGVNHIT